MWSLRSRVRALRELRDVRDGVRLVQVGAFAAIVPLLMRFSLPRAGAIITRPPRRRDTRPEEIQRIERIVGLAPRVARPLVKPGCLTRGLTLYWFLRREGLDVELRFGLDAGEDASPDGHCWLALGGEPFLEKADPRPRFAETYRLPAAA